jgi:hypothetical protein
MVGQAKLPSLEFWLTMNSITCQIWDTQIGLVYRTGLILLRQNQSLRYATHQLKMPMGMVASSDHKMGKVKSAMSPSATKVVQKTLRCIP